jgi:two-component system, LytTR family, sensor kinase
MQLTFKNHFKILVILIPLVALVIHGVYEVSGLAVNATDAPVHILHSIVSTAMLWLGCQGITMYLWRKYPWEHFPIKHLIIEVLAIALWVLMVGLFFIALQTFLPLGPHGSIVEVEWGSNYFIALLISLFITSIYESVFFYNQWKINFSKSVLLEKDNIEAKYETLKSQINPHFLFNSLNSLAQMVDDNNQAVDYIQNLSEFLRYVLKSRDRELVLVRDEAAMLEKYLALQKSRFRANLNLRVNIPQSAYHYALPPLVLQMLVENCIKHNVISKDKPLTIAVEVQNHYLAVENNLQPKIVETSTGQGLRNITDRYAFFTALPVNIVKSDTNFRVEIPLLTVEL